MSRPAQGQPRWITVVTRNHFLGFKWQQPEAGQSLPSCAKVKNGQAIPFYSLSWLYVSVLNVLSLEVILALAYLEQGWPALTFSVAL
jgi:hypothetical protein